MDWFNNLWKGIAGAGKSVGNAAKGAANSALQAPGGLANLASRIPSFRAPENYGRGYAKQGNNPASFLTGLTGKAMSNPSLRGTAPASVDTPMSKGKGFGKNLLDFFGSDGGKVAAGVGIPLIGQAFAPKVNVPDFGSLESVKNLKNFNNSSLPSGVEDSINRSVDINQQREMKNLQDVYRNARPGTDYTTDSVYQRDLANLQRKQTLDRADAQANALLQFNQQELSHLSEVAQLDVGEIMLKLHMDYSEAANFKKTFGNIGSMFLSSGLGLNSFDFGGGDS